MMNLDKFNSDRDCFPLLERLEACFNFKTPTSVAFEVGRRGKTGGVFSPRGWLDVHYPVQRGGFTKAILRVSLPKEYLSVEHMQHVVKTILAALEIPPETLLESLFFAVEKATGMSTDEPGSHSTYL